MEDYGEDDIRKRKIARKIGGKVDREQSRITPTSMHWPAGRLHAGDKLLRNIAFCVHQQQQQFRRNTAMAPTGRTAGKQAGRSRPATDRAAGCRADAER
uniref:Uncharacterized protein n=1 Tax=Haemonchus contortus TaxID=6289 RepID=A0A7I4YTT1_HAECO